MHKKILLSVGITILFLGVGIQPAFANVQNELIQESVLNPNDKQYLANFTMDFGENITNDRIDYESIWKRPERNYTINVKINFRCPENLKIVVKYEYYAEVYEFVTLDTIYFCDVKDNVTIINGSNPPDINVNYTEFCPAYYDLWKPHSWMLILRIKANLTAYKYLDGEWVKLHNDDTFKEIKDVIIFNRIRPSERTRTPDNDDCNLCPKKVGKSHLTLLKNLLNRLERYKSQLSALSKVNPEFEEKYQETYNKLLTIKELSNEFKPDSSNSNNIFLCLSLLTIAVIAGLLMVILNPLYWKYEDNLLINTILTIILIPIDSIFVYALFLGEDKNCWDIPWPPYWK